MRYYKRFASLLAVIMAVIMLSGCSSANIALTDEESDRVAEYMSYLFLKYDKNYSDSLVTPTPTPTPRPTKAPTPTPEPTEGALPASDTAIAASPTPIDPNTQSNADYAEVIGLNDLEVKFIGYELRDSYYGIHYVYNSDESTQSDNMLSFSVEAANKDNQLLLVSFEIENRSSKARQLDLRESDIKYQMDINTGLISKPLLTLLDNDLQYINIEMPANGTETGVIVFEVPKNIDLEKVYLMITKESKTAIIKIV